MDRGDQAFAPPGRPGGTGAPRRAPTAAELFLGPDTGPPQNVQNRAPARPLEPEPAAAAAANHTSSGPRPDVRPPPQAARESPGHPNSTPSAWLFGAAAQDVAPPPGPPPGLLVDYDRVAAAANHTSSGSRSDARSHLQAFREARGDQNSIPIALPNGALAQDDEAPPGLSRPAAPPGPSQTRVRPPAPPIPAAAERSAPAQSLAEASPAAPAKAHVRPPPPPIPSAPERPAQSQSQSSSSSAAPSQARVRPPAPPIPGAAERSAQTQSRAASSSAGPAGREADEDEDLPTATDPRHRKPTYEPYMDKEEAERRVKQGTIIKGQVRVSASKPSNAWVNPVNVKSQYDGKDILIKGRNSRNRAVNGDIVYVEVIEEEGDTSDSDDDLEPPASRLAPAAALDLDSDFSDEEICDAGPLSADSKTKSSGRQQAVDKRRTSRIAKVVGIAEAKGRDRVIVCTLHPFNRQSKDSDQNRQEVTESDRVVLAKPTDCRMPWIMLQINDVTRGVLKIPGRLNKYEMWPIQILKWEENSHLPLGRLKGSCLGVAGDLEAEVKHALINNELDDHDLDFEDDQLDEVDALVMAAKKEFENEKQKRCDLQGKRIFTIDPATAKDLDDAIHVDFDRARGEVEIGVHIADVAHFVQLGSLTDTEAQRRTTSVYLIDRVLPMLPHALCNHLCSLNPNEPKLAFSAYFRLKVATGELVENPAPWFKKTVIKSCCRLNYDEAQEVLNGREFQRDEIPPVYGNHSWQQIKDDLFLLYDVCGKVRTGRMEGGAMSISKTKMIFHTRESEDGMPTGYHLESHSASHWIIEELMLLANRCVATHLALSRLSQCGSVLRNHEAPDKKKAEVLEKLMKNNLNIHEWDCTSAGALYKSCQMIYQKYGSNLGQCIEMMTMRAGMKQAQYFVYSDEENPHHFALNFNYYTHFTSPIRRYPDVMVHRVLYALLADAEDGFQDKESSEGQVKICNEKKTNSRRCQEQLDRAVFCVYLRRRQEWFYTTGNVLGFGEDKRGEGENDNVTIYCAQLGREKKSQLCSAANLEYLQLYTQGVEDELLLPKTWKFRGKGYLELHWPPPDNPDGPVTKQKLQVLSCVPVVIIPTATVPIDFAVFIVSPLHRRFGQVNQDIPEQAAKGFEYHEVEEDGVEVVHSAN